MKKIKTLIDQFSKWAVLSAKATGTVLMLWFSISYITTAYTNPSPQFFQAEKKVGDIDGYWFELPLALSSNTIHFGGGAKILHILKHQNGKYQIKFSMDDRIIFDNEFENRHGLLQANLFVPFGGGHKIMILKTDQILIFERMPYMRMGKIAQTYDIGGQKFFQVILLDMYNKKQPDTSRTAKPDTAVKTPFKEKTE